MTFPCGTLFSSSTSGGFLATWTDSQGNEHCNAVGKTTRLEAECSAGEGIALVSYGAHCDVPGIDHLGRTHTNYCLANWTEGFYTYMLLYNRYKDSVMPCMRSGASVQTAQVAERIHCILREHSPLSNGHVLPAKADNSSCACVASLTRQNDLDKTSAFAGSRRTAATTSTPCFSWTARVERRPT